MIVIGVGQLRLRIAAHGTDKDSFGCVGLFAVAFPCASIPLGQPQFDPVRGAIHATMETLWINKGFQQQQRMTKAGLPIGHHPPFGQR